MPRKIISLAILASLAGCTGTTPYPTPNPIYGAAVSANPYPPGSPQFCRTYARQTAGNSYENKIDRQDDSYGESFLYAQQARRQGQDAYRRCLARHTR